MTAPEALMVGLTAGVLVGSLLTWLSVRLRAAGRQARVQDLLGDGSGGLNGTYQLNAHAVVRAAAVDQLFGGAGGDWFWLKAADQLSALADGEIVTFE